MRRKVLINDYVLNVKKFQKTERDRWKISFDFTVTNRDYHDVTTLLYRNDLFVEVPEENLAFKALITNYSTSITNLYEEGAEGEFQVELTEKK